MDVSHFRGLKCYKCGKSGHRSKECKTVNQTENKRKIYCWGCGQEGHVIAICRTRQNEVKRTMGHGQGGRDNNLN